MNVNLFAVFPTNPNAEIFLVTVLKHKQVEQIPDTDQLHLSTSIFI